MRTNLVRFAGPLVVVAAVGCSSPQTKFASPEEAIKAVSDLIGTGDEARADAIFGPGSMEMFRSGDDVADQEDAQRVKALIQEKVGFEALDDDSMVALLGKDEWPFAIPLVREDSQWRFDSEAGEDELTSRRVGRNEIHAIATLHAFVDAQREYYAQGRDGNAPCYAQRLLSSDGKHDGLCWPVADGETESPLGDELAEAALDGYEVHADECEPFHGYMFRILTRQGAKAPGGERSYVDAKGLMTGGFAAVAWPAKPGNSGVMTFVVNQRGIVFQKDLGDDTVEVASAIEAFDPDDSWAPTDE